MDLIWIQRVERDNPHCSIEEQKGERQRRSFTRERWGRPSPGRSRPHRRWAGARRRWEEIARVRESRGRLAREKHPASGSGGGRFLKNSLWAHRTAYSACSVHTGQRTGKGVLRARPVHWTVHSAVSGAHRTVRWVQTEGILNFFKFSIYFSTKPNPNL
jgi:hypothetical protein